MPTQVRWRSARRHSSEKSARAVRREARPYTYQAPGVRADAERRSEMPRKPYVVPSWLVKGVRAHFSATIGQPPTRKNCLVLEEPFQVNGPKGAWVTLIEGQRGWVACEALSPATS